jgi:L-ascorbate metabolism protein UlaG (beta-lactamase superfamily)
MNVTWLGQGGLYIESDDLRILIDPYLSDSVGQKDPDKKRRLPVLDWMLELKPDVLIFTHDHMDHYDEWTASHFLKQKKQMTVLGPGGCWQKARAHGGGHNYVLFDCGTEWTEGEVRFTAVPAVHSDPFAIGLLVETAGLRIYITGDTLYSARILECLPTGLDAIFLPINGAGNNMNMTDAARFALNSGAKQVVPIHWGMFDDIDPEEFPSEHKVILKYGEKMELERVL